MPVQNNNSEPLDECNVNITTSLEKNGTKISAKDEDIPSKQIPVIHKYSSNEFQFSVESKHGYEIKSSFDEALQGTWDAAKDKGAFNYLVDNVETKILPGKYNIVAQLNVRRATLRRKPEEILSIIQPFNPDKFNFTKIKDEEILFNLKFEKENTNNKDKTKDVSAKRDLEGSVIINTAPICYGHSLLLPHIKECRPQVLNKEGIELAIHTVLLSVSPSLRVGFNSLCAYASVNHYHFHMYYLPFQMYNETAECERLCGPCFIFKDFYSKCLVFQLENNDVSSLACSTLAYSREVLENIAYNKLFDRSSTYEKSQVLYDTVGVPLALPVESGAKSQGAFNPALCELSGHVPIFSEDHWSTVSEDDIVPVMQETSWATFNSVLPKIKQVFA
ncbi:unnamed protein product, partial [Meganyctiphanes norvegica]